jgi:hypothetical protein
MRAFEADQKTLAGELEILGDGLYRNERPIILELIRRLQAARSPDDYMELQLKLIGRARARQQMADELRGEKRRLRADLAQLVNQEPKPLSDMKELQHQLDVRDRQRQVSEALRWILTWIGDAMAWKLLGFDRGAITILGQGNRVARFADPGGFDAEVVAMEKEWKAGRLAIHNDLTSCLRTGDLTVVDQQERSVSIVEVKLSKELGPDSPQMKRMEDATTLINQGRIERSGAPPLNIHRIQLPYRTYLANLRDLVARAQREGYAAAKAGGCQLVEVLRPDVIMRPGIGLSEHEAKARQAKARENTRWFDGNTRTFQWSWAIRRMRDRRYSFSALAPLPLLPLDPEEVTDLVMGYMNVIVTLNADCVAKAFVMKGLNVEIAEPPEAGDVFFRATKRTPDWEITVQVSSQLREQMLNELMTPANVVGATQSLIEVLASRSSAVAEAREEHVVAHSDETRVWGA